MAWLLALSAFFVMLGCVMGKCVVRRDHRLLLLL